MKTLLFGVALLFSVITVNAQFVTAINAIAFNEGEGSKSVYWLIFIDVILWTIFYHLN